MKPDEMKSGEMKYDLPRQDKIKVLQNVSRLTMATQLIIKEVK